MPVSIGEKIELNIEKIVYGGEGLGYYNDFAIFVPMSVPGDKVEIEIISKKKSYARGIITKLLESGEERIDRERVSFEDFHGCDFGMLNYDAQLKYKELLVKDVMEKIGGVKDIEILPIVGSEKIYNYRNKVIEPFAYGKNKEIITGMFEKRSHNVFQVKENMLSSELSNKVINKAKEILNRDKNISVYNEIQHRGILRHIMTRTNSKNEAMVVLVVNLKKVSKEIEKFLLELYNQMDEIKSIYVSLNTEKTNFALGKTMVHLFGQKTILEEIEGIKFNISPSSFFQINLDQTKKLYNIGISYFDNIEDKYIIDAFSGTGTIGMILSKKANKIYSIEIVKSAVEDGIKTSKENGINNMEFIIGDVNKEIKTLMDNGNRVDSIIFDPPRKGIEESTLRGLTSHKINELVYISCNPSTFARDTKILLEERYTLEKIQPVDMFPQTVQIEVVGKFTLKK
ncbi:23S rRNA (uracil(1939)-C(5))-methyltransferase RlmD [Fusobacterium sp.]|uniref:23S rRNA (uracil(1939)-C(5))-methyltransferase RlmD n=1 Tax=Fusobacterium sp. TaxID=68766 RepID=UPI00263443B6|nr:23S rRNA (uracil(1939)-C(5))-methyltransferase RlmD [Fusobacterium sp.]